MQAVGPETAFLFQLDQKKLEEQAPSVVVDLSQNMWDYRNRGKFNGVPVEEDAKQLLVNTSQQLQNALQPVSNVKTWTGYISPQNDDKKYLQEYAQIKQREIQGQIYIMSQDKQFCSSLNKFLLFVTYNEVQMGLNPRYRHLKESTNG